MNNFSIPKPSLIDLAQGKKSALLAGCGGGGDIMQTIPVMNLLKKLGVEQFCLVDIGCKWWEFHGEMALGCEVLDLDWLSPCERVGEHAALISKETKLTQGHGKGEPIHEGLMANVIDVPIATVNLRAGVPGVKQGFLDLMERFHSDIFITCDAGADAFFTGTETQVQSPLVDAISILCASEFDVLGVYAVAGFGGDAELPMSHLIRNMGIAMQKGGYLGASGLTQEDVDLIAKVLVHIPGEEVEKWSYEAAKGNFGTFYCKRLWSVEMTPSAAVVFFFDPDTMFEVNPIIKAISRTKTLLQAEEIIMRDFNLFPETRLPITIPAPVNPQVPD